MLGLKFETKTSWAEVAKDNLEQILTDHAFAEQKASANAISITINYSEETELVSKMLEIAIEELEHFQMVHQLMIKRGLTLGQAQKNDYALKLQQFFSKTNNRTEALIQRLLVAALIEARSCERFKVFSENIKDNELADFYNELMISEANHYTVFLNFARQYQDKKIVNKKWQALLTYEAELMRNRGKTAKVHG